MVLPAAGLCSALEPREKIISYCSPVNRALNLLKGFSVNIRLFGSGISLQRVRKLGQEVNDSDLPTTSFPIACSLVLPAPTATRRCH